MSNQRFNIFSWCETPPGIFKDVSCSNSGISIPFSYFHSPTLEIDDFEIETTDVLAVLEPDQLNPNDFLMFNLASKSTGSGISSSGTNLQFIDTLFAGSYEFHIQFVLTNLTNIPRPDLVLTLGTPAAAPYINPNTGFQQVTTEFQPTLVPEGGVQHFVVMHGVVDLPLLASTAILMKVSNAGLVIQSEISNFNVTVKKLA